MNLPSISVVVNDTDTGKEFVALATYDGRIFTQKEHVHQWTLDRITDQPLFLHTLKKSVAHKLLEHLMETIR